METKKWKYIFEPVRGKMICPFFSICTLFVHLIPPYKYEAHLIWIHILNRACKIDNCGHSNIKRVTELRITT